MHGALWFWFNFVQYVQKVSKGSIKVRIFEAEVVFLERLIGFAFFDMHEMQAK